MDSVSLEVSTTANGAPEGASLFALLVHAADREHTTLRSRLSRTADVEVKAERPGRAD
jgi:hypothetical protein